MSDIERQLRQVGETLRHAHHFAVTPNTTSIRRVRVRRAGFVVTSLALVAALVLGGSFAAGAFDDRREDVVDGPIEPPVIEVDDPCDMPFGFVPTYLPPGFDSEPQPGSGGERGIPLDQQAWPAYGHYLGDGFIDVWPQDLAAFAQIRTIEIEVLGQRATLGEVHEGFSVNFRFEDCDYSLLAYGLARPQLRAFAEGLEPRDGASDASFSDEAFAIWPEDTPEEAEAACLEEGQQGPGDAVSVRSDPESLALEFADLVLGWESAIVLPKGDSGDHFGIELRRDGNDDGATATGAAVVVAAKEVARDCWSITSVVRPPDDLGTGVGIRVDGRNVEMGYLTLGASLVSVEIGHGNHTTSSLERAGEGRFTARLSYPPDRPGHFLILFMDENKEVFSANGARLPAGDFAAG